VLYQLSYLPARPLRIPHGVAALCGLAEHHELAEVLNSAR
jgi:hypothetical protein